MRQFRHKWTRLAAHYLAPGRLLPILAIVLMIAGPAHSHDPHHNHDQREHVTEEHGHIHVHHDFTHDEHDDEHKTQADCELCVIMAAQAGGAILSDDKILQPVSFFSDQARALLAHSEGLGNHKSQHARAPPR